MDALRDVIYGSGLLHVTWGTVLMWSAAFLLMFLAIKKQYEPMLLLPIAFGMLAANLPLAGLMEPGAGFLWRFFHYGVEWDIIPPLVFLGIGAMTDFGPVIANPKTLLLGAGAQVGVVFTLVGAHMLGFDLREAAAISIIGGADGPTTIYVGAKLAPSVLGATAVAAYSYMALVPLLQPPVMKLLTTKAERQIVMRQLRPVSKVERLLFPLVSTLVICLLVPASAPLMAMFMVGNLFRESGVVDRLVKSSQNELMNIIIMLLGLSVGATLSAETFLRPQVLMIFGLGMIAFILCTATGVLLAKFMNLFLKEKINPLIGAAGVSAVPMSARVVHAIGSEANRKNYLLMHAMGPNLAGVIGTAVLAGVFISVLGG